MIDWIIWYSDGSSYSSDEGAPHSAPRWGVVCIAERSPEHGRVIWVGHDYYWFDEDQQWACGDFTGLLDYLTRPFPTRVVLIGRSIPANRFHRVYNMAVNDERLPPKTSTDWLEAKEVNP